MSVLPSSLGPPQPLQIWPVGVLPAETRQQRHILLSEFKAAERQQDLKAGAIHTFHVPSYPRPTLPAADGPSRLAWEAGMGAEGSNTE